jgi:translation initiation factor RLI1
MFCNRTKFHELFGLIFSFIIVVEHDLSVLDYLSDFICCLYGLPGCYGVVTMPFSVREGCAHFFPSISVQI